MIQVRHLSRAWGDFTLRDICLRAEPREYLVILGPTGCGKTLLLETIAGIHRPYSGTIRIGGRNMENVPPYRRSIGFVYQKSMLFPNLPVVQNIEYGLKMRRTPRRERRQRVQFLADLLSIGYLLARDVTSLSGGEMQKVALARALAIEPDILLLDEPLSPLDQASKDTLLEEIRKLHDQLGTTTLHVTHDHNIARHLADRIALLSNGSLVQVGRAAEVFRYPAGEFAAEFVRAPNILLGEAVRVEGGLVQVNCDGFSLRARSTLTGPVGVTIPPEEVRLGASAPGGDDTNVLRGDIERIENQAGLATVTFRVGRNRLTATVPQAEMTQMLGRGATHVYAEFAPDAVHVFRREAAE